MNQTFADDSNYTYTSAAAFGYSAGILADDDLSESDVQGDGKVILLYHAFICILHVSLLYLTTSYRFQFIFESINVPIYLPICSLFLFKKKRGNYKCQRCNVPKKGHNCPYQRVYR